MIDLEQFKKRGKALWESQVSQAAARYWKNGKRKGTVRVPARQIEYTKVDLLRWLWRNVGLNAVPCHYCNAPVDILSLTLDHAIPKEAGGRFAIENMRVCCVKCNQRKGEMTAEGYKAILLFRFELSSYDQGVLLNRLAAAHHGSRQRFHRPKSAKKPKGPPQFLEPFK
jgi:hypothetical protein